MKRTTTIAAIILIASLAGCASGPPVNKATRSGYAEAMIPHLNGEEIRDKIVSRCLDRGFSIETSTETQVVCRQRIDGAAGIMTWAMIGNSYSTQPDVVLRFTIANSEGAYRVVAQPHAETQMAMGQMRRMDLKENNQLRNNIQAFLDSI
ncbi:hypothetical protein RAN53_12405 [Halomonas sp. SSL-5]|uniref:hypothetical protein n=1 Tax=Halomonas sp. SSL-5 TaxID=3065855 RepID=UPI002738B1F3|nr:hypothetical protein [Halomonas sp. SSL-5]MDY7117148.1 hypothetical protein [Halomonas sp. SSL-5]